MSERVDIRREDGFSLVELLVAMSVGMIVLFGILAIVEGTTNSSARTTARVTANQTARPALTKIIDGLHSSCTTPDLAPVQAGSGDNSITYTYAVEDGPNGSISVVPTPIQRTVALNTGTGILSQTDSPGTTTQIVTGVNRAKIGTTTVPLFRYYAYDTTTAAVSNTRRSKLH